MPKMICAKDQTELRPKKNGVYLVETFQPDRKPYRIWSADLWICPECGSEIISGFSGQGLTPIAEHFEENFMEIFQQAINSKQPMYYSHERN